MTIAIEINGTKIEAQAGQNIIELTDNLDIAVPRFCYHKKLSVAANCRMCLVDVEGMLKPQPACATPLSEGMKIWTNSDKAKAAQKAVMEFLLINHPLDCPICDQGGECELQDVAFEYGQNISRFSEGKRVVVDKDIGALIQTDMTRCIHCTRCIRFGTEIGGLTEMGATGRGESLTIEPFLKRSIESELSGNMIDVCPVGALTSKPFRYELRSWELTAKSSIARHDNIGSALWTQLYRYQIKRVVARENEAINQTWIADRERFSYEGLAVGRLEVPKIKVEEQWQTVSWKVALDFASKGIKKILNTQHVQSFGLLSGNNASLEDYYLLAKLAQALDITYLDYRLHQQDLVPYYLASTSDLAQLETADYIVVVGGNTRFEQPLLNHRLRQASLRGTTVVMINSVEFDYNFKVAQTHLVPIGQTNIMLGHILVALLVSKNEHIPHNLSQFKPHKSEQQIAQALLEKNSQFVLGEHLSYASDYSLCLELVKRIAGLTQTGIFNASMPNNAISAHTAGILPSHGSAPLALLEQGLKAYILFDLYPEYDCYDVDKFKQALAVSDFVLAFNSFDDALIASCADVILPIAHFYESSGTFINVQGDKQFSKAVAKLPKEAKPVWKIMRVLAEVLELKGFEYDDITEVQSEVQHLVLPTNTITELGDLSFKKSDEVQTIAKMNPYASDALLRCAPSLGQTQIAHWHYAKMNQNTAKQLALKMGDNYQGVPVYIDDKVANKSIFIYRQATQKNKAGQVQ